MVHADLSFKDETLGGSGGAPERPSDVKSLLHILTNEIEHARVRQDGALQELERHIRTLEAAQTQGTPIEWDQASADALAALYDHRNSDAIPGFTHPSRGVAAYAPHELQDVYRRMEDLEGEITRALHDLSQRRDLEGLREVEGQVRDLTSQLDQMKGQLQRLEAVETLVRDIAWQVSDERMAKLVRQGTGVAGDLEAMAARDAHQEELRHFISQTINDWRDAESRAAATARDLAHERHEMLSQLIETSIVERRQAEAQAMGVLDTLQEALVNVLDRIETLEASVGQFHAAAGGTGCTRDLHSPSPARAGAAACIRSRCDRSARWLGPEAGRDLSAAAGPGRHGTLDAQGRRADRAGPRCSAARARLEACTRRRDRSLAAGRASVSPGHAARGASRQAQGLGPAHDRSGRSNGISKKSRKAAPTGRLPGGPTTLLAAALALVVAINGGLWFFGAGMLPFPRSRSSLWRVLLLQETKPSPQLSRRKRRGTRQLLLRRQSPNRLRRHISSRTSSDTAITETRSKRHKCRSWRRPMRRRAA